MNIDELEKLARAAANNKHDWHPVDDLENGVPMDTEDASYINAANPAAILELIDQYKAMREALDRIAGFGGDLRTPYVNLVKCQHIALESIDRVNGESNE